MGPTSKAVFNITKNFPPAIASCAFFESEACLFRNHSLALALVFVCAQRNIASHDKGIVKATRIRVAFAIPNILVVAIRDPSVNISPKTVKNIPAAQYNFLFFMKSFYPAASPAYSQR